VRNIRIVNLLLDLLKCAALKTKDVGEPRALNTHAGRESSIYDDRFWTASPSITLSGIISRLVRDWEGRENPNRDRPFFAVLKPRKPSRNKRKSLAESQPAMVTGILAQTFRTVHLRSW